MPTQQIPQQNPQDNILRQRQIQKQRSVKKVKLILAISVLVLILAGIVMYAASRQGGVANLFKGEKDPISNSINNIGSSITGNDKKSEEEKLLEKYRTNPIALFDTPIPSNPSENSDPNEKKYINLIPNQSQYELTIKVGETVIIDNFRGGPVSLQFSDKRVITLRDTDEKTTKFSTAGTFTFEDTLDDSSYKVTGTVTVNP